MDFLDKYKYLKDDPREFGIEPKDFKKALAETKAIVDGVFFTRNLINEPANVLNTVEFCERLKDLSSLGVDAVSYTHLTLPTKA